MFELVCRSSALGSNRISRDWRNLGFHQIGVTVECPRQGKSSHTWTTFNKSRKRWHSLGRMLHRGATPEPLLLQTCPGCSIILQKSRIQT